MFARLCVGVAGLVFALLAATTASLAESPTPTPTAETSIATPTPVVTPVGCGFFASPTPATGLPPNPSAPGAPAAPTDLRAELVSSPELVSGLAVRLTWQDNADNETCFGVAVRLHGALLGVDGLSPGVDGSTTGPVTFDYVPVLTGPLCYQVYYGNAVGQSYSNEVCVDVEVLPVRLEPTPPPPGCQGQGPIGAPGTPSAPVNLRAELVPSSMLAEGFVIRLTWDDNATNDLCYAIEWTVGPERLPAGSYVSGRPPAEVGPVSVEEIPWQAATYCYRVQFGNEAGRSPYSNEACVDVEVLPVWTATPTPTPPVDTVTPSPVTTLTPPIPVTPAALPILGAGPGGDSAGLPWWRLAAIASALVAVATLSLVTAARRRRRAVR